MPRTRHVLSTILGLLLLAGIVYGVFAAARATIHFLTSANSAIAVAIIGVAGTVLVSVFSLIAAKIYESRALINKEHREKKIPVYEDLIKLMFQILMSQKTGAPPLSEDEMIKSMLGFTQGVMVWGSDGVLAAWIKWRRMLVDEAAMKANPKEFLFLYEQILFAIRRDLGHKNKALIQGDILALFINDIDKYLPKKGAYLKT